MYRAFVLYDADDNSLSDVRYQMPGRLAARLQEVISKLLKGCQNHARQCIDAEPTSSLKVTVCS